LKINVPAASDVGMEKRDGKKRSAGEGETRIKGKEANSVNKIGGEGLVPSIFKEG